MRSTAAEIHREIFEKPPVVQEILKVIMIKLSFTEFPLNNDLTRDNMDCLLEKALDQWKGFISNPVLSHIPEAKAAEMMIALLRGQESWGKILRGSAS